MNHILENKMKVKKFKVSIKDKEVIVMKAIKLSKQKVHYKEERMKTNDADKIS